MSVSSLDLPRLLYLGHVPVEASYSGPSLLYRLLQNWPAERLRIIETNLLRSEPERRLPGVQYAGLRFGNRRLLHTRFARWYGAWLMRTKRRVGKVAGLLEGFQPGAVLTVTEGFSWLVAAHFAAQYKLPLHLICHDNLTQVVPLPYSFRFWLDREFGRVYQQAVSRLCVSPFMCNVYHDRYGVDGTVLYPSRGMDAPRFDGHPNRIAQNDQPFTIAFAGTIHSGGYVNALLNITKSLAPVGGRLFIFGPLTLEVARQAGLECSNIVLRGLLKSTELMTRLRAEANALFLLHFGHF